MKNKTIIANKDFNTCVKKGSEYEVITENECTYTFKDDEGFIVNLSKFYFTVKVDEVVKKQQTAVDWLLNLTVAFGENENEITVRDIIQISDSEQAKQMEKEQIINAYLQSIEDTQDLFLSDKTIKKFAKQYYNETFGKDEDR